MKAFWVILAVLAIAGISMVMYRGYKVMIAQKVVDKYKSTPSFDADVQTLATKFSLADLQKMLDNINDPTIKKYS